MVYCDNNSVEVCELSTSDLNTDAHTDLVTPEKHAAEGHIPKVMVISDWEDWDDGELVGPPMPCAPR